MTQDVTQDVSQTLNEARIGIESTKLMTYMRKKPLPRDRRLYGQNWCGDVLRARISPTGLVEMIEGDIARKNAIHR